MKITTAQAIEYHKLIFSETRNDKRLMDLVKKECERAVESVMDEHKRITNREKSFSNNIERQYERLFKYKSAVRQWREEQLKVVNFEKDCAKTSAENNKK